MRKFNIILIIILFCVGLNSVWAQSSDTINIIKYKSIKFSPLNIIEPEPSLMFGFEMPLSGGKLYWQNELGYCFMSSSIFARNNFETDNRLSLHGFKYRTNFKTFFDKGRDLLTQSSPYFAIDAMYKYVVMTNYNVRVNRFEGEFSQMMDLEKTKTVIAFHMLFGSQFPIKNSRLFLDFYGGFGFRIKYFDNSRIPVDIVNDWQTEFFFYDDPDFSRIPSVMLGLKLGYRL